MDQWCLLHANFSIIYHQQSNLGNLDHLFSKAVKTHILKFPFPKMSLELVLQPQPEIYLLAYEMSVPEDSDEALLSVVAHKAAELKVCGYIAHTHCGRKVGGELEGSSAGLQMMVEWMQARSQGNHLGDGEKIKSQMKEPRFSKWKLQSGAPKYDVFFCCWVLTRGVD